MILRRVLLVSAAVIALLAMSALPAAAHVELDESEPAAGSTAAAPPGEVYLRFTGPVEDDSVEIRVVGPDGEQVEVGPTQSGARAAAAELPELAENGRYVVRYEGTSADGHGFKGRFRFRLRVEDSAGEPEPPTDAGTETTSEPASGDTAPEAASEPAATDGTPTSETGSSIPVIPIVAVVLIAVVAIATVFLRKGA